MPPLKAQLDHVVLLLPYKDITQPPEWLTQHFTISPGGRHADGKTENRLVLFADGTYLELIAFVDDDPEKRRGHWWDRPFGVIDFALTTPDQEFGELSGITERLSHSGTQISYAAPKEGGRHTTDGKHLQWQVTFPTGVPRGNVPFWCHDVTPREWRVPTTKDNTSHPSGACGMGGLHLSAPEASVDRLTSATAAILDRDLKSDGRYEVGSPHELHDAQRPSIRIGTADAGTGQQDLILSLVLQTDQEMPNIRQEIGDGLVSVVFERR